MSSGKPQAAVQLAPHSWDIEHWPAHVWPHENSRARYVARALRNELIAAGAMCRVGRELVFIGAAYTRWLEARRVRNRKDRSS